MKRIMLFAVIAAFLVPLIASAQPNTGKIYRDSLTAIGKQASVAIASAASYKYLRTDIKSYKDKVLAIKFVKVMDSLKIQGGYVTFGADTTWTNLLVEPYEMKATAGIYSATAGVIPRKDLDSAVTWMTPVTTNKMTFTVDLSPFYYPVYRLVTATEDSGKIYVQDIRRGGY